MSYRWELTDSPSGDDESAVSEGVFRFGRALAADGRALPLACFARDGETLVAGGIGRTEYGRLFVTYLWVAEHLRCRGLGTEVLRRMEAAALARGCVDSLIETLNDRIAGHYERLGYKPVATVEAYVGPFSKHILVKSLVAAVARDG